MLRWSMNWMEGMVSKESIREQAKGLEMDHCMGQGKGFDARPKSENIAKNEAIVFLLGYGRMAQSYIIVFEHWSDGLVVYDPPNCQGSIRSCSKRLYGWYCTLVC